MKIIHNKLRFSQFRFYLDQHHKHQSLIYKNVFLYYNKKLSYQESRMLELTDTFGKIYFKCNWTFSNNVVKKTLLTILWVSYSFLILLQVCHSNRITEKSFFHLHIFHINYVTSHCRYVCMYKQGHLIASSYNFFCTKEGRFLCTINECRFKVM